MKKRLSKKKIIFRLFIITIMALVVTGWYFFRESLAQEIYEIVNTVSDQSSSSNEPSNDLARDFISVATSNSPWMSDAPYDRINYLYYLDSETINSDPAKLDKKQEYKYRLQGVPPINVINKWAEKRDVYISVKSLDVYYQDPPKIQKVIENRLRELLPEISKITGINFFLYSDISQEQRYKSGSIGGPDIEFLYEKGALGRHKNMFKMKRMPERSRYYDLNRQEEPYYQGAVRFTPDTRSQAEGYFIPDHENNIDYAVCQISKSMEDHEDLAKALVSECMYRVLGLPNLSKMNQASILGPWNKPNDQFSSRWIFDGEDAFFEGDGFHVGDYKGEFTTDHMPIEISEYDKFLLCLLYQPKLKQGMSTYVAFSTLVDLLKSDNTCKEYKS